MMVAIPRKVTIPRPLVSLFGPILFRLAPIGPVRPCLVWFGSVTDRSNWYNAQFALSHYLRVESGVAGINVQLVMRLQNHFL